MEKKLDPIIDEIVNGKDFGKSQTEIQTVEWIEELEFLQKKVRFFQLLIFQTI